MEYYSKSITNRNYFNHKKNIVELKDFLSPILKEENVRQLLSYYNKKYPQNKNYSNNLMKNKRYSQTILEYSFITDRANMAKKKKEKLNNNLQNQNASENNSRIIPNENNKIKVNDIKRQSLTQRNITTYNKQLSLKKMMLINNQNNTTNRNSNRNSSNRNINRNSNRNKGTSRNLPVSQRKNLDAPIKIDYGRRSYMGPNKHILKLSSSTQNEIKAEEKSITTTEKESEKESEKDSTTLINDKSEQKMRRSGSIGFKNWYKYEKAWEQIKEMKRELIEMEMEERKNELMYQEMMEETFRPKINKKSIEIANKNYPKDFYDRVIKFEKKKKLNNQIINKRYTPTFKPNLKKKL